eukprot:COSAG02_NODE_2125_length_9747_cov_13.746683_2_plen_59_part_00
MHPIATRAGGRGRARVPVAVPAHSELADVIWRSTGLCGTLQRFRKKNISVGLYCKSMV